MIHELKITAEFFDLVYWEAKRFEIRKNDRNFKPKDTLILREWDPLGKEYTGRSIRRHVTHIFYGGRYGLEDGYCIMSLTKMY